MRYVVFALLLATSAAHAGSLGGVKMPDTYTVGGKTLVLNGMGLREATVLNVDVYVAGLYLENKTTDAGTAINSNENKRLHLVFVRDVDKEDITEAWQEGFKKNVAAAAYEKLKPRIAELNRWMIEFKEENTLTFQFEPNKGLEILVNGKSKGTIADTYFARVMFSVFLNKPPNAGLKRGLLGK